MVAGEETGAIAYPVTGTQEGRFQGVSPTGKEIKARGMQSAKFNSKGEIIERWGSSDEAGSTSARRNPGPDERTALPRRLNAAKSSRVGSGLCAASRENARHTNTHPLL